MRRLRRRLALVFIVYFFAGTVSQKLLPGVDEIFPFFGWALFSKIPNATSHYEILIHGHDGRDLDSPVSFLRAPQSMVVGNRYIARKVIQKLGQAHERNEAEAVERLRRLLERNYLAGDARYELVFESYDPLVKWRTGESAERRTLAVFGTGGREGGGA